MIEPYQDLYQDFLHADFSRLGNLYHREVKFTDPVVALSGLEDMRSYFESTRKGVSKCEFVFASTIVAEDQACMTWVMHFAHPRLRSGEVIKVRGTSVLRFDGALCVEHTDYYDMGALLYEHIPVLKQAVTWLKSKM